MMVVMTMMTVQGAQALPPALVKPAAHGSHAPDDAFSAVPGTQWLWGERRATAPSDPGMKAAPPPTGAYEAISTASEATKLLPPPPPAGQKSSQPQLPPPPPA